MGTRVELGDSAIGVDLRAQVVRATRETGTRENLSPVAGSVIDTDDDAGDRIVRLRFAAADRILAIRNLRARITQFGREIVGPLRIEAARIIIRLGAAQIEGVGAGNARVARRSAEIVGTDRAFLEPLIGEFETVVVVDMPVETAEIAVVLERTAADQRAGFDAVDAAQNLGNFVKGCERNALEFVAYSAPAGPSSCDWPAS